MRLRYTGLVAAALTIAGVLSTSTHAATIDPNLAGNTQYDGWADLTAANNPGYPGYPGSAPWPSPINSNQSGSGDAELDKITGAAYPASAGIYFGGFSSTPNTNGGTLAVSDSTPVAGLEHVAFQIEIGEAMGYDFFDNALPTLNFNGGSQTLAGTSSEILLQVADGTFTNPATGEEEPIYINTWLVEWDLSTILDPISSFEVVWSSVQHAQIYSVRLDQSDTFATVPTPSTFALGLAGFGCLMLRRRRNSIA